MYIYIYGCIHIRTNEVWGLCCTEAWEAATVPERARSVVRRVPTCQTYTLCAHVNYYTSTTLLHS